MSDTKQQETLVLLNIVLGVLMSILVGLGGWNLYETHCLSQSLTGLSQAFYDSKDIRIKFQTATELQLGVISTELQRLSVRVARVEIKLGLDNNGVKQ